MEEHPRKQKLQLQIKSIKAGLKFKNIFHEGKLVLQENGSHSKYQKADPKPYDQLLEVAQCESYGPRRRKPFNHESAAPRASEFPFAEQFSADVGTTVVQYFGLKASYAPIFAVAVSVQEAYPTPGAVNARLPVPETTDVGNETGQLKVRQALHLIS